MTPTIELICGHRSIRHFTDEPISEAQCEAIINSARATSSLNRPGFPGECFICELRL
ncbi:TPA: hypothetical protein ACHXMM_002795, partial [Shigella boydii]